MSFTPLQINKISPLSQAPIAKYVPEFSAFIEQYRQQVDKVIQAEIVFNSMPFKNENNRFRCRSEIQYEVTLKDNFSPFLNERVLAAIDSIFKKVLQDGVESHQTDLFEIGLRIKLTGTKGAQKLIGNYQRAFDLVFPDKSLLESFAPVKIANESPIEEHFSR